MKKVIYVIVVLLILLALAFVFRSNQPAPVATEEAVAVEENGAEDTVIVVDEEPASVVEAVVENANDTTEDVTEEVGEVVETVVEENPEATSGEGETIVEE